VASKFTPQNITAAWLNKMATASHRMLELDGYHEKRVDLGTRQIMKVRPCAQHNTTGPMHNTTQHMHVWVATIT
jgi:hypothetical protein